ncbi:EamA family transporter [Klebsiella variicola]
MSPFYLCTVVRKYVYPSAVTAYRGAVCAVYHLGLYLFCHRRRRRQLAPLMMAGIRFLSAGVLLLGWLLATGHKLPARRPLLNAALIGVLLLAVGNGFVTLAEHQHVPSGIAAVMVATVPLFTLCFSRFFGIATRKLEWLALPLAWQVSSCSTAVAT